MSNETRQPNRRAVLKAGVSLAAGAALWPSVRVLGERTRLDDGRARSLPVDPKADAMILIWLPGGIAQTDTWDPKVYTPFEKGMSGSDLRGTCPLIDTPVDDIKLGAGLKRMAGVMDEATILRSLTNETMFGAIHLKAQYYMMTGYLFPAGVKAPSIGSVVSRTLGRRDENVPAYIYIGRDIDTSDEERLFISEYIGPGFYGVNHAPFMIPDPAEGLATLEAAAGMEVERIDRRSALLRQLVKAGAGAIGDSQKTQDYLKTIDDARAMMDSPVKQAFNYREEESAETIAAYEPKIARNELRDTSYYNGQRFGHGLLLARRLVERGARFIQVEYQYGPFKGFDMHEFGASRMDEMKRQFDGAIAQLIIDLRERGLLERTQIVIMTEFGRTIAAQPAAGVEPDGFAERQTGEGLTIAEEGMYGFHGHFSSANSLVFFGGGFKRGFAYGRTADRHPMVPIENPVCLEDAHATIYRGLGIPADTSFITEGRPFYVTKDGKGNVVDELLA